MPTVVQEVLAAWREAERILAEHQSRKERDLARQRVNELNAIISYNRSLVNFEAVQTVPLGGGVQ